MNDAALNSMNRDSALTAEEQALVETARRFAGDAVAPHAGRWEEERRVPVETLREAADAGLCGLLVRRDAGGAGASHTAAARVCEELAQACMAFTFGLVVHNNLAANIARNGTPEQIARYLPAMLRGKRIGAFLLTEPGAGSDAAAIQTAADKTGDGWVIDGDKAWITNGAVADTLSVYAQTDAEMGWRGIACFLVEGDNPGVERQPAYALMGGHAMGTNGMRFRDCRVASTDMLLGPGDGFKASMAGINLARTLLAACCCGVLRASLGRAIDYAAERRAFGQSTLDFQGLQWKLCDVATDLEAARLLTYRAAAVLDGGGGAIVEAAHAKKFASRAAFSGVGTCMQAMGAAGFRRDHPLARHLASAKMAHYLDGTTEIQDVVIGRHLKERYGRGD